jgi:uncharacterized protein (TIGR04255 family)
MPHYKRPPVIEAVIEVRFGGAPLVDQDMEALRKRLSDRYPTPPQQTNNLNFEVVGTAIRITQQNLGFRILSADGMFTVIVARNSFVTSTSAPYPGWEEFMTVARVNWSDWKRVVDWKELSRIGLRYINRIDVPFDVSGITRLEDYFGFKVDVPESLGDMANFGINAEIPIPESSVKVIINHAPVPSPLVQCNSFLLDLDFSIEQELPANEKGLWEAVEGLRSLKNSVFEACITDKTRELFS